MNPRRRMFSMWLSSCVPLLFLISPENAAPADVPRLPVAPGMTSLEVSSRDGFYTEPGIAVNTRNPKQILVVYQGGASVQGGATAAYSVDAGQTFTVARGTELRDWRVAGDVTTTFDD